MLSWFQGHNELGALLARKEYDRAIEILEHLLAEEPESVHLRQLYADVSWYRGDSERAVAVLLGLVDDLTRDGQVAKSIAVLKKIQRIDPEDAQIAAKLAAMAGNREVVPTEEAQENPPGRGEDPRRATSELLLSRDWFAEAAKETSRFQWSPLFEDLSPGELTAFFGNLRLLIKKSGSIIVTEGQPGDSLFVLASGSVRVYRRTVEGGNEQVAVLEDGDVFGKPSVLSGARRTRTFVAATECQLLEVDKANFDGVAARHPQVRDQLAALAAAGASGAWE